MDNDGLQAVGEVALLSAEKVLAFVLADARAGIDGVATLLDLSANDDDGERSMAYLDAARDMLGSLSRHFHGKPDHGVSASTRAMMVDAGLVSA